MGAKGDFETHLIPNTIAGIRDHSSVRLLSMEKYTVTFEDEVIRKEQIFEGITDVVKLGFSGISNWDAFDELIFENLEARDIQIVVNHESTLRLPARDLEIYLDLRSELSLKFGDKIQFNFSQ
ncbi:hypothetical protein CHN51_07965 [Sphingorhabdus sp. YGSMI21]|nr:hypothetical protein CHN51_07965 [Sphingorhabdus sp. YGSMI21]